MLTAKLMSAMAGSAVSEVAESVDFDGTNDYLSRASDLTGNADGKTFTFSAWVWNSLSAQGWVYDAADASDRFYVNLNSDTLEVAAWNSAGTNILFAYTAALAVPKDTFSHILISIDLANTANRSVYVNDAVQSVTWSTYTNSAIDFTVPKHLVAARYGPSQLVKGRHSHVFLDYTYRDLNIEANRRLFITADRKPAAGQAALNPILYMKLDDPTTAHINSGTGGNFTLTGTVARAGRGPNQFNAPYSDLDGSADYLSRSSGMAGVSSGKSLTASLCFRADTIPSVGYLFAVGTYFEVVFNSGGIYLYAQNSATTNILNATVNVSPVAGRNYVVTFSLDLSNTANRSVYVNGTSASVTWTKYNNDTIAFASATTHGVGATPTSGYRLDGKIGNVFFHTSYIDLSVAANRAKFFTGTGINCMPADMGANGELPLGVTPLLYLPMYGNNAGKNYGSGGDFTVNSGPYLGARGPNEFWGNLAAFDGASSTSLSRTSALAGVSDGKVFSLSYYHDAGSTNQYNVAIFNTNGDGFRFGVYSGALIGVITNTAGYEILRFLAYGTFNTGWIQVCIDLSNTSKRFMYFNGVAQSVTWTTYTDTNIQWTSFSRPAINSYYNPGGSNFLGASATKLAELYFATTYIDFSQEANRLKFRDAFGNPVALLPQIEKLEIPTPAIYMRFDPANQGKNDGTGGDFTKSGTITDGGQL